jgi:diguanylate cyclase (GGDEF)-like protein
MATIPASVTQPEENAAGVIGPIEIAPRTWWLGCALPGDSFQCHSYLIEHGDQSVLIDPGSLLTWPEVKRQVDAIVGLHNVRYFICHHQDPDIAASLPAIDAAVTRPDAVVVTHWRAEALLKHYGLGLPFWRIDEHDWRLDLGGRNLRFVATPYCHFAGAFATFDARTGTLFSSDLFGGFTETWSLYAQDETYFEQMRPFHEHYMPSREILGYTLSRLDALPIRQIAPQHGSIIPERLVRFMIDRLKTLECGLYLVTDKTTDIRRLSMLNASLREITEALVLYRDFRDIAGHLLEVIRRFLPAASLEFFAAVNRSEVLALVSEARYHGAKLPAPPQIADFLGVPQNDWKARNGASFVQGTWPLGRTGGEGALIVPLFSPADHAAHGAAVIRLERLVEPTPEVDDLIGGLSLPLQVAVEREMLFRSVEIERESMYQRSIRDPLTGLFSRHYLTDQLNRLCSLQDRGSDVSLGLIMFDIDNFKSINDRFGHLAGDRVLAAVSRVLLTHSRATDIPVRFGGEEFALFAVTAGPSTNEALAERIREGVANLTLPEIEGASVTISGGVAMRAAYEPIEAFMARADRALYRAKNTGRNRIS